MLLTDLVVLEVPLDGATEHNDLVGHALAEYEVLVLTVLPALAGRQFPFPDGHVGQTAAPQRHPSACNTPIRKAISLRRKSFV